MKKKYVQPMAAIQQLKVSNFVAGACNDDGGTVVGSTEGTCLYNDPSGYVFFSDNCDDGSIWGVNIVNPNPNSPFAQVCYHRPADMALFFAS